MAKLFVTSLCVLFCVTSICQAGDTYEWCIVDVISEREARIVPVEYCDSENELITGDYMYFMERVDSGSLRGALYISEDSQLKGFTWKSESRLDPDRAWQDLLGQGFARYVKSCMGCSVQGRFVALDMNELSITYVPISGEYIGEIFNEALPRGHIYIDPYHFPVAGDTLWLHQSARHHTYHVYSSSNKISGEMQDKLARDIIRYEDE